jgi:hypothetical protein
VLHLTADAEGGTRSNALMQWLISHSAAVRLMTGTNPNRRNNQLDQIYLADDDSDKGYRMRGLTIGDLDKQVEFYLLAQQNVRKLFDSANILYSSQPLLHNNAISPWYRKAYRLQGTETGLEADKSHLQADLDGYMTKASTTKCANRLSPYTLGYFMGRSALRLEQAVATWSAESKIRDIVYANAEMVFPGGQSLRMPYFIDNAHMSDLGQRRIAEYFAGYILQSDLKISFDPAKFASIVLAEAAELRGPVEHQYSPRSAPPAKAVGGNRVLEGMTHKERSPGALQFNEKDDAGYHRVIWSDVPAAAGKDNTLTIDAWSDVVPMVRLELLDNSGAYCRADFDLVAQKVVATSGKDGRAQIVDLGKGWKRMTLTTPLAAKSATFNITLLSAEDELTYQGGDRSIVITEPVLAAK